MPKKQIYSRGTSLETFALTEHSDDDGERFPKARRFPLL